MFVLLRVECRLILESTPWIEKKIQAGARQWSGPGRWHGRDGGMVHAKWAGICDCENRCILSVSSGSWGRQRAKAYLSPGGRAVRPARRRVESKERGRLGGAIAAYLFHSGSWTWSLGHRCDDDPASVVGGRRLTFPETAGWPATSSFLLGRGQGHVTAVLHQLWLARELHRHDGRPSLRASLAFSLPSSRPALLF